MLSKCGLSFVAFLFFTPFILAELASPSKASSASGSSATKAVTVDPNVQITFPMKLKGFFNRSALDFDELFFNGSAPICSDTYYQYMVDSADPEQPLTKPHRYVDKPEQIQAGPQQVLRHSSRVQWKVFEGEIRCIKESSEKDGYSCKAQIPTGSRTLNLKLRDSFSESTKNFLLKKTSYGSQVYKVAVGCEIKDQFKSYRIFHDRLVGDEKGCSVRLDDPFEFCKFLVKESQRMRSE